MNDANFSWRMQSEPQLWHMVVCESSMSWLQTHIHIAIAVFQITSSILTVLCLWGEITPCPGVMAQEHNNWDLESLCRFYYLCCILPHNMNNHPHVFSKTLRKLLHIQTTQTLFHWLKKLAGLHFQKMWYLPNWRNKIKENNWICLGNTILAGHAQRSTHYNHTTGIQELQNLSCSLKPA